MSRYVRLTREANYATFNGDAAATDVIWPRLPFDEAFNLDAEALHHYVRDHFSDNRIVEEIAGRQAVQGGSLQTYLYPEQTAWILTAITPVNGVLPSFTADYFDGVQYRRQLGCVFTEARIAASEGQDEGAFRLNLSVVGQKIEPITAVNLPKPASLGLTTRPWKLSETKGGLLLRAADPGTDPARTKYNELEVSITNEARANWDEDIYISDVTYHGRTVNLSGNFRYVSAVERQLYLDRTPMNASLTLTKGDHVLVLDFQGNGRVETLDRSTPLAAPGYNRISLMSLYDDATADDFTWDYEAPVEP